MTRESRARGPEDLYFEPSSKLDGVTGSHSYVPALQAQPMTMMTLFLLSAKHFAKAERAIFQNPTEIQTLALPELHEPCKLTLISMSLRWLAPTGHCNCGGLLAFLGCLRGATAAMLSVQRGPTSLCF